MIYLPAVRYRRDLAASYDLVNGSRLLSERVWASALTPPVGGQTAQTRSLNRREAA